MRNMLNGQDIIITKMQITLIVVLVCSVSSIVSHPVESTFRNLVCQQCNSWCSSSHPGTDEAPRVGKAGPRGPVGPAGPAVIVNMTAVEALVDRKLDEAIGFLKIKSCGDVSVEAAKSMNGTGGVFEIANPITFGRLDVYCDVNTDGGKWTVIQKRMDGSLDFYRDWNSYADGFGNVENEFWLGLEIIHEVTKKGDQELRIDMIDINGIQYSAKYSVFHIASALDQYKLTVGGYSGNASDSLAYHNKNKFSTKDRDHDVNSGNCAQVRKGAWWYMDCAHSNLNGDYENTSGSPGVVWYNHGTIQQMYMRYTEMKIRRKM